MSDQEAPVSGGVLAAALTPLDDELSVDLPGFVTHCKWLLEEGCTGLAVLGTTGEANAFSVPERLSMLDALVAGGVPGARLIPGTGCCALPDTVMLTRQAVEIGAAGVLMLPPFYYKPVGDDSLFAAYSEVIQRVGDSRLRILLYNIPQNTGVPITHGLIEKLVEAYPQIIVGIKDSAGDLDNMLSLCRSFPGFRVFSGSDTFLLPLLRAGGAGSITACNNVTARLSAEIHARPDGAEAETVQERLSSVRAVIQGPNQIAALKEIMARFTGAPHWRNLRPPLVPLGRAEADALIQKLDATGFALTRAA